jgi:hypothetical protein
MPTSAIPRLRGAGLGILSALGIATLFLLAIYTPVTVPAEDAVILHQYSRNLAETGVISFIPHGPPAEGATDFLWMVYIAAAMKLHMSPGVATSIANILSAGFLAIICLRLAHVKVDRAKMLIAFGILAVLPQMEAALRGFSVLPFAALIGATFLFAAEGKDILTAVAALLLCLTRPDGAVFAIPIILFMRFTSLEGWRRKFMVYTVFFVGPGLLYFAWRAHYFHELLPLPFLVKSNVDRKFGLFVPDSLRSLLPYVIVSISAVGAAIGWRVFSWQNLRLVIPLFVIPTLFYANMRLEQNLNDRFFVFYPIGICLLLSLRWASWQSRAKQVLWVTVVAYVLLIGFSKARSFGGAMLYRGEWSRLRNLAAQLGPLELRGTMLTSEAGLLPYFSRWTAYDSWGLNSPEFARRVIQPEQVVKLHPDIAIVHGTLGQQDCKLLVSPARFDREWNAMKQNVQTGLAELQDYDTWRVPYWSPTKEDRMVRLQHLSADYQCWYLSREYKGRAAIEDILPEFQGVKQDNALP